MVDKANQPRVIRRETVKSEVSYTMHEDHAGWENTGVWLKKGQRVEVTCPGGDSDKEHRIIRQINARPGETLMKVYGTVHVIGTGAVIDNEENAYVQVRTHRTRPNKQTNRPLTITMRLVDKEG